MKSAEYKPTSGHVGSRGSRLRPAWAFDPCLGGSPSTLLVLVATPVSQASWLCVCADLLWLSPL